MVADRGLAPLDPRATCRSPHFTGISDRDYRYPGPAFFTAFSQAPTPRPPRNLTVAAFHWSPRQRLPVSRSCIIHRLLSGSHPSTPAKPHGRRISLVSPTETACIPLLDFSPPSLTLPPLEPRETSRSPHFIGISDRDCLYPAPVLSIAFSHAPTPRTPRDLTVSMNYIFHQRGWGGCRAT